MTPNDTYTDIRGNAVDLRSFDAAERKLFDELKTQAAAHPDPDTGDFFNYWLPRVGQFYAARGLSRRQTIESPLWRVAQDLHSRLLLRAGRARLGDYRDELLQLIATQFGTRRKFCDATGLSEDMLSHVLAKRKNLSLETLTDALARIGYSLHIAPLPESV